MFKGKVQIYKNLNGKEENINREFDNEQDFNQFLQQHKEDMPSLGMEGFGKSNLESSLEDFFNRRFGSFFGLGSSNPSIEDNTSLSEADANEVVDLSKYDREYKRLKEQEKAKEDRKKSLEDAKERLKNYKEEFKKAGEEERVKEIDEDLKKVEEELNNM